MWTMQSAAARFPLWPAILMGTARLISRLPTQAPIPFPFCWAMAMGRFRRMLISPPTLHHSPWRRRTSMVTATWIWLLPTSTYRFCWGKVTEDLVLPWSSRGAARLLWREAAVIGIGERKWRVLEGSVEPVTFLQ